MPESEVRASHAVATPRRLVTPESLILGTLAAAAVTIFIIASEGYGAVLRSDGQHFYRVALDPFGAAGSSRVPSLALAPRIDTAAFCFRLPRGSLHSAAARRLRRLCLRYISAAFCSLQHSQPHAAKGPGVPPSPALRPSSCPPPSSPSR